jgi:hypothetical protein
LAPTFGLLGVVVGGVLQAVLSGRSERRRAWQVALVDACLLRDELAVTRSRVMSALDSGRWGAVLDPGLPYAAGLWAVEHREGRREPSVWPESGRRLAPFVRARWQTISAPFLSIATLSDRPGTWSDDPNRELNDATTGALRSLLAEIDDAIAFLDEFTATRPARRYPLQCLWAYLSYQPSRKARPRVPLNRLNISSAGVASRSISIFSAARARTAKM